MDGLTVTWKPNKNKKELQKPSFASQLPPRAKLQVHHKTPETGEQIERK